MHNNTWQLILCCDDMNLLSCKWVFHILYNPDGSIALRKVRLVVKGFGQLVGLNYNETFNPLVKSTSIRIVLSIAITYNWVIRKLDVKNAFLDGDLYKDVCMTRP